MLGWRRLKVELDRWREAGKRPRLWWRDDDARVVTPQLHRLIVQAARVDLPLCLCVIPEGLDKGLCASVAPFEGIAVLQHGVSHRDDTGTPSEFRPEQPPEQVAERLAWGWSGLEGFGRRLPVYVPPWNVLTPNVEHALSLSGHRAVSGWGGLERPGRVDAHIDLLRWRGGARFAGRERVLTRLAAELRRRRREGRWGEPVGLLTHHLAQDEPSWRFLEDLLLFAPLRERADWPAAAALFGITDQRPAISHPALEGLPA